MSTIIRCRRRGDLESVSYIRLYVVKRDGMTLIDRTVMYCKDLATYFKHREVAEAELKRLLADPSERHDEYTYDLIDGGVA